MKLLIFIFLILLPTALAENSFSVKTDQKIYGENEIIKISIIPEDNFYTVQYNGDEYNTTGTLEIPAVYPANNISVNYGEKTIDSYVHVKNNQPLSMAFSLTIFGTVNYALVGLIKKYWGWFL